MGKQCHRIHRPSPGDLYRQPLSVTAKGREEGCSECKWVLDLVEAIKPGWTAEGLSEKYCTSKGRDGWNLSDGRGFREGFTVRSKATTEHLYSNRSSDPWIGQSLAVMSDSGSAEAFDRIRHWYTNCVANHFHDDCNSHEPTSRPHLRPATAFDRIRHWYTKYVGNRSHDEYNSHAATSRPRRLVDLTGRDNSMVRLIQASELQDAPQYACLSYRWGDDLEGVLTTTASNIQDSFSGIHVERLPKTIIDAITVCRALNIPYLWVDSLCIIQGDPDDFAIEGARMDEIYANSHLTIYAKHATSCKDGFLGPQARGREDWQRLTSLKGPGDTLLFIRPDQPGESHEARCVAALDTRGWCFQESILPKRQLIYCGDEMMWKCQRDCFCECGHVIESAWSSSWHNKMERLARGADYSLLDHVSVWMDVVQGFSPRLLTRPTDKLAAVSGLARRVLDCSKSVDGPGCHDTFHAGLWRSELIKQLSWVPTTSLPRRRLDNDVPTWSWASLEGAVTYSSTYRQQSSLHAQVLDVVCFPAHLSNPFGPVQPGGYLDISAQLLPVKLAILDAERRPPIDHDDQPPLYLMEEQEAKTPRNWVEVHIDVEAEILPLFRDPSGPVCWRGDPESCGTPGCACRYQISKKSFFCSPLYTDFDPDLVRNRSGRELTTEPTVFQPRPPQTIFLILESTGNDKVYRRVGVGCLCFEWERGKWSRNLTTISKIRII